jgi:hypothetical protein
MRAQQYHYTKNEVKKKKQVQQQQPKEANTKTVML